MLFESLYLARRTIQELSMCEISCHCHSSLDWQPPNSDRSDAAKLSLLLAGGLGDVGFFPASFAFWSGKPDSLEGVVAAIRALRPGTPTG